MRRLLFVLLAIGFIVFAFLPGAFKPPEVELFIGPSGGVYVRNNTDKTLVIGYHSDIFFASDRGIDISHYVKDGAMDIGPGNGPLVIFPGDLQADCDKHGYESITFYEVLGKYNCNTVTYYSGDADTAAVRPE